jgi:TRAP-type C4-dicarboxylate transport system substrate-binding protein
MMLFFFFLGTFIPICQAQAPVVLRFSYAPPATGLQGRGYEIFAKAVNEESGGTIEVKTFPAGSLVSDPQILDAIIKGTVDLGHFAIPYVTPTIKELTPLEVPGAYPGNRYYDLDNATHPIVEKIFAKYGVKYLGLDDASTITFLAIKKFGKGVTTPADLKGQTVRSSGKWLAEGVKMWGGSPVMIPLADVPIALGKGTVTIGYIGWVLNNSLKLYESAPYITFTELQEVYRGIIMSDRAWKKLNAAQQDALMKAVKRWMTFMHENLSTDLAKFENTLKGAGVTVQRLTKAQNDEFKNVTEPLWEKVAPAAGPEGLELIKTLRTLK